jgi:tRNA nucleotidyltransferase (CCA-adding enzyme)
LALRLDGPNYGDLHDYWGGLNDLRQGLIRVLHSLSFVDDPTRMLRAVRFEGRFNFTIETRTLELLGAALELLERVSGDRIRHELDYILDEQEGPRMFDRLRSLGLMEAIHPDLTWSGASRPAMFSVEPAGDDWGLGPEIAGVPFRRALAYILWLLPLPAERSRRIARRLQLRGSLAAVIADARRLWEDLPELAGQPPSTITFRLDEADPAAVYAVWQATEDEDLAEPLARYARSWRHIKPGTDGHALDRRGLPPGPAYKHILTTLRRAWLDGEISSEEEEGEALERLLRTELQG